MTNPYYVILTGAKNNAGDFLIAQRARALLQRLRPDRNIVEYKRWEEFSAERLEIVNGAQALLLTGGPALQPDMYPHLYPLTSDLDAIRCPILTFGIGWKAATGAVAEVEHYALQACTRALLARIDASGFSSSLRDYRSAAVTARYGYKNFVVTGCPALFSSGNDTPPPGPYSHRAVKRIGFSLGVSLVNSQQLEHQTRQAIEICRKVFPDAEIIVAFHHSPSDAYRVSRDASPRQLARYRAMQDRLDRAGIAHADISGSAERLVSFYNSVDLHVGYRVHAHIFMLSAAKPSVLIAEDGRGTALREVVGGAIFDSVLSRRDTLLARALRKSGVHDGYRLNAHLLDDLRGRLADDKKMRADSIAAGVAIAEHYATMRKVVESWP